MRGYRKFLALPLILAAVGLFHPGTARGQANALSEEANIHFGNATERTVCEESNADQSVQAVFRLVCLRDLLGTRKVALRNAIVIGFVGGFVRSDDVKHPEVQFAALLRRRYPSIVHAEVFANHDGKNALRRVLQLLDSDGDGVLTAREREQASIIIYGHSWGSSQVVTLARQLGQQGVPVLLTIQVDSVHKPRPQRCGNSTERSQCHELLPDKRAYPRAVKYSCSQSQPHEHWQLPDVVSGSSNQLRQLSLDCAPPEKTTSRNRE